MTKISLILNRFNKNKLQKKKEDGKQTISQKQLNNQSQEQKDNISNKNIKLFGIKSLNDYSADDMNFFWGEIADDRKFVKDYLNSTTDKNIVYAYDYWQEGIIVRDEKNCKNRIFAPVKYTYTEKDGYVNLYFLRPDLGGLDIFNMLKNLEDRKEKKECLKAIYNDSYDINDLKTALDLVEKFVSKTINKNTTSTKSNSENELNL